MCIRDEKKDRFQENCDLVMNGLIFCIARIYLQKLNISLLKLTSPKELRIIGKIKILIELLVSQTQNSSLALINTDELAEESTSELMMSMFILV